MDTSKNRNHRFSVILIVLVIAVCMMLFAGCRTQVKNQDPAEVTALEEIQERGVLKVGATGDYMPMSYLDPKTGGYVGFDTELADEYFFRYIEDDDVLAPAA